MISVIVPVYKVEPYLNQCVESILCQTYSDLEILLIDDGSPDRCGQICDEYEKQESYQLEYVEPSLAIEKNRGVKESPYNRMMFEREAHVLELLLSEGLLK